MAFMGMDFADHVGQEGTFARSAALSCSFRQPQTGFLGVLLRHVLMVVHPEGLTFRVQATLPRSRTQIQRLSRWRIRASHS